MKKIMQTKKQLNKQFNLSQHACTRIMLTCLISGAFCNALALPLGEQVQNGNVGFVRDGQSLNINQTSQQAIVNWQSFGIAANEAVRLIQPNQGSALFRVTGSDPSQIFGSLSATGSLFLVNPNGVLFAPGAQVNVGSLVATTMQINDQDFLAKRYQFSGDSEASVVNKGVIKASDGGYIVLLGEQIENSGSLIANQGSMVLGSAQSALLDFYGDGLVQVKLSGDALAAAVSHTGNITADGGAVQLATQARTAALNVDGVVQANSLVSRNGLIRLEGGTGSKVKVTGRLEAQGVEHTGRGGEIVVTGEQLALLDTAVIDVSGQAGGGTVLVGGDYQGKNTALQNARTTYVGSSVSINANAVNEGNGGKVVVWSDDTTRYYGNISALGGAVSGNGGFVEVSGKQNLDFNGGIKVAANNGIGGFILLDPQDILLNTSTQPSPTNNANGTPDIAFSDAPAAGTTTVQIADVTGYSELFLQATRDITVANAISMGANNSIRLEANNNITLNAGATMTVSGTGSIYLRADADNSGIGALTLNAGLVSRQGGIVLSGAGITGAAAGTINTTGAANLKGGNVSISSTGSVSLLGAIAANGGAGAAATAGGNAGAVEITAAGPILTAAINATGGTAGTGNAAGGNAGLIKITTNAGDITTGALTARTGAATGTGAGGLAGSILVTNTATAGNVTLGSMTTTGNANGNGGSINVDATGLLTLNGAIASAGGTNVASTTQAGKNAGVIALTGNGGISTLAAASINANGSAGLGINQNGGNAGDVTLNASGIILARAINSQTGAATGTGVGGAIGGIAVTGATVTIGNLTTTGGANGNAGNISAVSTTGNLTVGAIAANGGTAQVNTSGRNAAAVTLNSAGTVTASTIAANGSAGNGAMGNFAGGNGAVVSITGVGGVTTTSIAASGGAATTTNANGGNAGSIAIANSVTGNINTTTLTSQAGNAAGTGIGGSAGSILVTNTAAAGNISTTNISTTGATNAHGGNVNLGSAGNVTVTGTIATSGGTAGTGVVASGRNAGNIAINGVNRTIIGAITANGAAALGANQSGGNAGVVSINGSGVLNMAAITSRTGNATGAGLGGVAGGIALSGSSVTSAAISTAAGTAGNGGNVSIATTGTTTSSVSSINANNLGTVSMNINDTLTVSGVIAGTSSVLTKSGLGTLILGGVNTYSGATNINAGTLTVTNASALGAVAAGTTVANGATLNVNAVTLAAESIIINGNGVAGIGALTGTGAAGINGTVTTASDSTIGTTSAASTLTLNGAVTAVNNLGIVGAGNMTATNAANNFSTINIAGANNVNLQDSNAIILGNGASNVTGNLSLQTAGAITQAASLTVGGVTTLNAGVTNDITLNNVANNFNTVAVTSGRDVSLVDANALTLGTSSVRTITARTLGNDLTLGGNITAAGTGSGTSIILASAQNFLNPGNSALTPGAGSRWLVYSANPALDTRGAGLMTASNFKQYNTLFGDAISGTGNGFVYSVAPTITATLMGSATKTYDGDTTAPIGSLTVGQSGTIDGDTVNLSALSSATYDNKNAGVNNTVTSNPLSIASATNAGKQVFGYTLANPAATGDVGTINKASLTINAVTDSKTYDGSTGSAGIVSIGPLFGTDTVTGAVQAFASKNVLGTNGSTLNVTGFTLNDGNGGLNYITGLNAAVGSITAQEITVTSSPDSKIYDGNISSAVTPSITVGSIMAGDSGIFSQTYDDKNAGVGKTLTSMGSIADGNGGNNYAMIFIANNTGVINPRALIVTANAGQNKTIGTTDPLPFTFTVGGLGLVSGDTLYGALNRTAGESVGNYAINQGSLSAGSNYSLSYTGYDFTISAASLDNAENNSNPRTFAGLVDWNPMLGNYTNRQLFILNVGFTAAGNEANELQADLPNCEANPDSIAKDKDYILMLNYGLKLPKGLNANCI
ncbi:MAG: filamentous hemagglutinin N-terminal domain-containing protein [Methylotenera sp.]|nr:filamentous hemagglutinin N-terminal domain-containing protein [Methylotenera sp.]